MRNTAVDNENAKHLLLRRFYYRPHMLLIVIDNRTDFWYSKLLWRCRQGILVDDVDGSCSTFSFGSTLPDGVFSLPATGLSVAGLPRLSCTVLMHHFNRPDDKLEDLKVVQDAESTDHHRRPRSRLAPFGLPHNSKGDKSFFYNSRSAYYSHR